MIIGCVHYLFPWSMTCNTDLYAYMQSVGPGIEAYSGKTSIADIDGVDMAYRLLADHARMITVTNAPNCQIGKCVMFWLVTNLNKQNINVCIVYIFFVMNT